MVMPVILLCVMNTVSGDYLDDLRFIRRTHHEHQIYSIADESGYTMRETNEARLLLGGIVRLYQIFVSPQGPPGCNYTVTCSQFMARAVRDHGAIHGILMTADRLDRCIRSARRYYPIDPVSGRAIDHPIETYYLGKKGRRLSLH
ncbi:hypothetical protein A2Y85_02065 [candidate division WOR-3 bacterium RBG_13_43_14]|uniref:Membrane protein insertion efficiency factor YidD n=1 Tax=candidate division WOR-3 bacterium RBG_13_43_14 TaxID=1802590 RepID=A0A1F4U8R7_UNCW3|nr:MAG: hypothetical protein A2Y85_02065 [candidate division WOR-3 bacterium RBG_13_43_14]